PESSPGCTFFKVIRDGGVNFFSLENMVAIKLLHGNILRKEWLQSLKQRSFNQRICYHAFLMNKVIGSNIKFGVSNTESFYHRRLVKYFGQRFTNIISFLSFMEFYHITSSSTEFHTLLEPYEYGSDSQQQDNY